jgi:nitrite reductase/ring-hydroxylating ferredoxin subunit
MIAKDKLQLLSTLVNQGWIFSESQMVSLGDWTESDADWNYRDIPHLQFVHSQVQGALGFATDNLSSSLFVQKVGPFRVVLTVALISTESNSQIYFTSVGPIVLIIETDWKRLDTGQTRVTTIYSVGTPRILRLSHWIAHKVLGRNYRILMSEDIPMRNQRAKLRSQGFSFRQDSEGHSYADSLKTAKNNVVFPSQDSALVKVPLVELTDIPSTFICHTTSREILIWKKENQCFVAPTFCPHEGAALAAGKCVEEGIQCPWHGRIVRPISVYSLDTQEVLSQDKSWINQISINEGHLIVSMSSTT